MKYQSNMTRQNVTRSHEQLTDTGNYFGKFYVTIRILKEVIFYDIDLLFQSDSSYYMNDYPVDIREHYSKVRTKIEAIKCIVTSKASNFSKQSFCINKCQNSIHKKLLDMYASYMLYMNKFRALYINKMLFNCNYQNLSAEKINEYCTPIPCIVRQILSCDIYTDVIKEIITMYFALDDTLYKKKLFKLIGEQSSLVICLLHFAYPFTQKLTS